MGKSPLTIIHETPVLSPVLNDSSPNVNGIICGGTVCHNIGGGVTKREIKKIKMETILFDLI